MLPIVATAATLDHVTSDELAHVKAACQRSTKRSLEKFRGIFQKLAAPRKRGIADQNIDAAQRRDRPFHNPFATGTVKSIPLHQLTLATQFANGRHRAIRLHSLPQIIDHHIGAGPS